MQFVQDLWYFILGTVFIIAPPSDLIFICLRYHTGRFRSPLEGYQLMAPTPHVVITCRPHQSCPPQHQNSSFITQNCLQKKNSTKTSFLKEIYMINFFKEFGNHEGYKSWKGYLQAKDSTFMCFQESVLAPLCLFSSRQQHVCALRVEKPSHSLAVLTGLDFLTGVLILALGTSGSFFPMTKWIELGL